MLKALVNIPTRLLDRILRFPANPKFQQTRMVLQMFQVLKRTYDFEVSQGIFAKNVKDRRGPIRRNRGDADSNFERLLSVSVKLLAQISEQDKYYRQWLGLLFVCAAYELDHINLSPKQTLAEISQQWKEDLTFLSEKRLLSHKREFNEILLTWYLSNIALEARKQVP